MHSDFLLLGEAANPAVVERRLGIQHVRVQVSADKFFGKKMNVWNKMNGITVITERISCLRFSNFEAAIAANIITRMGTNWLTRLGIQIMSGSLALSGQHETKGF